MSHTQYVNRLIECFRPIVVLTIMACFIGCNGNDILRAIEQSNSKESWQRTASISTLENHDTDSSRAALRKLAADEDTQTKGQAIRALGRMRDHDSTTLLIEALTDNRTFLYCETSGFAFCRVGMTVAEAADEALKKITGKRAGFDPSDNPELRQAVISRWKSVVAKSEGAPKQLVAQ